MPFGLGRLGWFFHPYWFWFHPYWFWRCYWFPWLPRWWWTGIYGPIGFYPYIYPATPFIPKEEEISILQDQEKMLEDELKRVRARIEELKK